MPDLTKEDIAEVIQDLTPGIVRKIIQDTVPGIVKKIIQADVPAIVRQETNDLRSMLGNQDMKLKAISVDASQIKENTRHLGVLYEDLDERFKADAELLRENLNVKDQVDDHENRIAGVESIQAILKSTVRKHSRQLKTK